MQNPLTVLRGSFRHTVSHKRNRTREELENEVARRTVRRIATGNVRLQRGEYVTREDINQQWDQVKNYRFNDG